MRQRKVEQIDDSVEHVDLHSQTVMGGSSLCHHAQRTVELVAGTHAKRDRLCENLRENDCEKEKC